MYKLFDNIYNIINEAHNNSKKNEKYEQYICMVQELITKNYRNENLDSIMLAEEIGLTPEYLRRLFNKVNGETLGDYINKYRVDKVKQLLLNTTDSINDIVMKTGFRSINYFYTIFKKINGTTPNEFRDLHNKE